MYCEIAMATPANRNIFIPVNKISEYIKHCQINNLELYRSVFNFDDTLEEHLKAYKSIKTYNGNLFINDIILDIDINSDTNEFVLERARNFYHKLVNVLDLQNYDLIIYYSGRGYHFKFPDYFNFIPSPDLHREVRATITELFPEVDKSIYTKTGLIRVGNTINRKVNRYKIPLTINEFLTLEVKDILELSNNPRNDFVIDYQKQTNLDLSHYKVKTVQRIETNNKEESTRIITCMQHLFNKGSSVGRRHIEALRLVSAWRIQGLTQSACITLLKSWASTLNEEEILRIVKDVYNKGYRYGCHDEVMMSYCDPKCIYYKHKNYITDVMSPNNIEDMLYTKIMTMPNLLSLNLRNIFNLSTDYNIYEGELVVFWGDTKIGKSTLVQNIIANIDIKTLYLSLENRVFLDARRLLQIKLNLTKEQVYDKLITNKKIFSDTFPYLTMIEQSISLNDLYKIIADSESKIVVIDTLDQLKVPKTVDYTTKTEILANELRDFANDTKAIIFAVHHISKNSSVDNSGNHKSMHIHSGKGSSAIEQKADKIISIEGGRNSPNRIIKSLGARDENSFEIPAYFDTNTFRLITAVNLISYTN